MEEPHDLLLTNYAVDFRRESDTRFLFCLDQ